MINSAYLSHHSLMMETEKVSKMSELCSNLMQVVTWEFIIVIKDFHITKTQHKQILTGHSLY